MLQGCYEENWSRGIPVYRPPVLARMSGFLQRGVATKMAANYMQIYTETAE